MYYGVPCVVLAPFDFTMSNAMRMYDDTNVQKWYYIHYVRFAVYEFGATTLFSYPGDLYSS